MCGYRSRYPDLIKLLADTVPACAVLQETMLGNRKPIPPSGYTLIKDLDPVATPGHGLALLVKNDYPYTTVDLDTNLQAIAIQIYLNRLITICNIYISPNVNVDHNSVIALVEQLPKPYVLLGDFNAKHELWGEGISDARGRMIADWVMEANVCLLNDGSPTHFHIQNNTLHAVDLALCSPNVQPALHWSVMEDLHGSDHYPVKIETETESPQRQKRYNISKANWGKYRECAYVAESGGRSTLQERYRTLIDYILETADQHIPKTNPHIKRPVPWWTPECQQLRQERRSALRRFQRTGILVDKILYKRARAKSQYMLNRIKRESWQKYISKITIDTPASKVWKRIRKLSRKYPVTHPPCLQIGGSIISDPDDVCETMAEYYAIVSSSESYSQEFNRRRVDME